MDFTLIASAFETLGFPPPSTLILLEARALAAAHVPPFPPDIPALLTGLDAPELALHLRSVLQAIYPGEHPVYVVSREASAEVRLRDLGQGDFAESTLLYVPSLGQGTSFESFMEIVAHLRAPDGCPWDREQTHRTLRTHLLEEAYETLAAMDADEPDSMREEFGDLMLQILLNSQIAREGNEFTITQVIQQINEKLIRRHPHVFGDTKVEGVSAVLQNWEKLKEKERKGRQAAQGLLDGVPLALPALNQAQEYQDRAARVGFDWPEIEGVLDKVHEEIEEIKKAGNIGEVTDELGDLFFVLVNLARWRRVDAESALRQANLKFKKRFAVVEQGAKGQGRSLSELTLEEMDGFWDQAKQMGL